jgi:hypothetical protein
MYQPENVWRRRIRHVRTGVGVTGPAKGKGFGV